MKKAVLVMLVVAFIGFSVAAAWAGPAEETGRKWAARAMQLNPELFAGIDPQAAQILYYIDLMSNAPGWQSYLVVSNWSLDTRIQVNSSFIPTNGTPSNIVNRLNYINPNEVAYLNANTLGFNSWGQTNWFGVILTNIVDDYVSCGILLYSSEYGLTWVPADGPYFL